ncbi:DUF6804 family protein [Zhouia sp. PK063]|uniref:DUF6804 family protein n=1 Tax=Zhouia sp. PK063 TaxID=3373602 RepID=UPI0037B2078E
MIRIIGILCAILLCISLAHMPSGYYTFLRIFVSMESVLIIIDEANHKLTFWSIVFAIILITFNPIAPIFLLKKAIWAPVDLISAGIFLHYSLKGFLPPKEKD